MKLNSFGRAFYSTVSVAAIAGVTLTACGGSGSEEPASSSNADCGGAATLTAEGSTAQKNAMDEFVAAWGEACEGKTLNYNATGSGTGRTQFIEGLVDFAGSDSALKEEQIAQAAERCGGNPAWNLPLVFGPVAMAFNVEGVDSLVVNADVLAKIYQGQITNWNDPAIAALNEGTTLPDLTIAPVSRSGSSGTTDNFQKYLSAAAPSSWTLGDGSEFLGTAGEGADSSAGVAQAVGATPGSIGYVEKGYAVDAGLSIAQIDSGAGAVELTDETVAAAIDAAKFAAEGNDLTLDLDALYALKQAGAYPLVLATYEIVCSKGYEADKVIAIKSFLTVAANEGQANLSEAGYVPLPDAFKERLLASIEAIS
ncbi:MAG: phosphate ABC transporter substrate-binding protein PstS [Mycobacterium sp.]